MKKIVLLFVLALGLSFVTLAQRNATLVDAGFKMIKPLTSIVTPSRNVTDTLWPAPIMTSNLCGDTTTAYITGQGGYVTGNNVYGDLEKGTLVKHTGNGNVTGVLAAIYPKFTVATASFCVKIYSKGADSYPGTLLGTSNPVLFSSLTSGTSALCAFTFTSPVAVSGDFFTSVVLPTTTGDTVVVFETSQYCSSPDSLSMEKWSDDTFHYFASAWGFNPALWIGTVIDEIVSVNNNNAIENVNVYSSDNKIVVKNNSNTTIKQVAVYNLLGQEIANYSVNNNSTFTVDANLPAASYIVRVITDKKVGTYKLYVNR